MKANRPLLLSSIAAAAALLAPTSAWAQADEARAKKIAGGSCFLCHGAMGESTSEIFPRLAGQHAEYIAKQLNAFQSGERKSTAMAEMVKNLIRMLAKIITQLQLLHLLWKWQNPHLYVCQKHKLLLLLPVWMTIQMT